MSVNLYYGNAKDATITTTKTYDASYPVTNVNILNKNIYSEIDDSGSLLDNAIYYIELMKIDYGEAVAADDAVLDVSDFAITLSSVIGDKIDEVRLALYYSTTDVGAYSLASTFYEDTGIDDTSYGVTLNDIYADESAQATDAQYYKLYLRVEIVSTSPLSWVFAGNINNLYIGKTLELPDPNFYPTKLMHKTSINTSFAGIRSGMDAWGQRKGYQMNFENLSESEKDDIITFDEDTNGGAYPIYMEHTTDIIDPVFCRVMGGVSLQPTAYENYSCELNIEEEL